MLASAVRVVPCGAWPRVFTHSLCTRKPRWRALHTLHAAGPERRSGRSPLSTASVCAPMAKDIASNGFSANSMAFNGTKESISLDTSLFDESMDEDADGFRGSSRVDTGRALKVVLPGTPGEGSGASESTRVAFNDALDATLFAGTLSDAVEVLRDMEARGVSPDIATYEHVLCALVRADNPGPVVEELFAHILRRLGPAAPSISCWSARLAAWAHTTHGLRAVKLFDAMRAEAPPAVSNSRGLYVRLLTRAVATRAWPLVHHVLAHVAPLSGPSFVPDPALMCCPRHSEAHVDVNVTSLADARRMHTALGLPSLPESSVLSLLPPNADGLCAADATLLDADRDPQSSATSLAEGSLLSDSRPFESTVKERQEREPALAVVLAQKEIQRILSTSVALMEPPALPIARFLLRQLDPAVVLDEGFARMMLAGAARLGAHVAADVALAAVRTLARHHGGQIPVVAAEALRMCLAVGESMPPHEKHSPTESLHAAPPADIALLRRVVSAMPSFHAPTANFDGRQ